MRCKALVVLAVVLLAGWGVADTTLHPQPVSPDAVPDPTSPKVSDSEAYPGYYNTTAVEEDTVDPRWDNLVAGWTLDEESDGSAPVTRADVLGTYELTDNNTVASAAGLNGNAASLVVADSTRLTYASGGPLGIAGDTTVRGVSFWYKPTNFTPVLQVPLDNKFAADGGYRVYLIQTTGRIWVVLNHTGGAIAYDTGYSASAGSWNFLAFWIDSGDSKLYMQVDDNTPTSTAAITLDANVGALYFNVGSQNNPANYFGGLIDDLYLFTSYDSDLATDLYNGGAGRSYPD